MYGKIKIENFYVANFYAANRHVVIGIQIVSCFQLWAVNEFERVSGYLNYSFFSNLANIFLILISVFRHSAGAFIVHFHHKNECIPCIFFVEL
jgi:hypothetical protein